MTFFASFFDVFAKLPKSQNYYKTNRKTRFLPSQNTYFWHHFSIIFLNFFWNPSWIDFLMIFPDFLPKIMILGTPWRPKWSLKPFILATCSAQKSTFVYTGSCYNASGPLSESQRGARMPPGGSQSAPRGRPGRQGGSQTPPRAILGRKWPQNRPKIDVKSM